MEQAQQDGGGFRFVDLFAGIGGFHVALAATGGTCVLASEIDHDAQQVYRRNFPDTPLVGDVREVTADLDSVPEHDVLAAGFPCQPFSKSGAQRGMDETRGTLFWDIAQIVERRRPSVLLLENVRNIAGPRHRHEWEVIVRTLRELDYLVSDTPALFSPHLLPPEMGGRPQVRERVFITATYDPSGVGPAHPEPVVSLRDTFEDWDAKTGWSLKKYLDSEPDRGCELSAAETAWIDAWNDWVKRWYETPGGRPPGFPVWADSWRDLDAAVRRFGRVPSPSELMSADPSLPAWKASHLAKNYALYDRHRSWIDEWASEHGVFTNAFPASRRKLEWQAQDAPSLWDCVMHLRPSGIRAKQPTYVPALVAITQTSIYGPEQRRLSPREAARLQGLDEHDFGSQRAALTYKQLGNGVNVGVVEHVLRRHLERDGDVLVESPGGRRVLSAVRGTTRTQSLRAAVDLAARRGQQRRLDARR